MDVNSKKLTIAAVCYCWVGVVIFLLGWVRWYWALPAVALIFVALVKYWRDLDAQPKAQPLVIRWPVIAFVAVVMFGWLVVSGSGAIIGQTEAGDWEKHNLVLKDLIEYNWPVYYHNGKEDAMLTYYVATYLIPALFGKLFHSMRAAEIAMLINNFIGMFIAALLLLRVVRPETVQKQILTTLIFVFFGVVLILGQALYAATPLGSVDAPSAPTNSHWISTSILLQYPYNYSHLRWTFPQTITPWILTGLFADKKENSEHYLLLATPLMIHATFPFLGIALLMMGYFAWNMISSKKVLVHIRRALSVPNLCTLGSLLILFIYLYGNFAGDKEGSAGFTIIDYEANITLYFCFCATFLCYSVVLFDKYKDDILFYLVNGVLLMLPFFNGGACNDLCMRASVPALYCLMVFCIRGLFAYAPDGKKRGHAVVLAVLMLWGMYYSVYEMQRTIRMDPGGRKQGAYSSLSEWADRDGAGKTLTIDVVYNYFTYDYENSAFYRYFARKP